MLCLGRPPFVLFFLAGRAYPDPNPNVRSRDRRPCALVLQADVLETGDFGGDKLSGLEFAGFSG